MAAESSRVQVDFYRPGDRGEGRPSRFRYHLDRLGGARPGSSRIGVTAQTPTADPGAYACPFMDVQTADVATAFLAALAVLDGFHAGLESVSFPVEGHGGESASELRL